MAKSQRLSLHDAVWCYRNEYRVERLFTRLKSRVPIAPLFVKLNEQIEGLTSLLPSVSVCERSRSLSCDSLWSKIRSDSPVYTERTSKRGPTSPRRSGS